MKDQLTIECDGDGCHDLTQIATFLLFPTLGIVKAGPQSDGAFVGDRALPGRVTLLTIVRDKLPVRHSYVLACEACGRNVGARAETLHPIIRRALELGIATLSLPDIERRLTGK